MSPSPEQPDASHPIRGPVAVTGAAGFIGRHVVAELLRTDADTEVRALLLPGERLPEAWLRDEAKYRVEVVRGDVTDASTLTPLLDGARTVIHLAAVVTDWAPWKHYRRVTVEGTRRVLSGLPAGTRVVLASSIVVYGHRLGRRRCSEDVAFGRPRGHYSRAKQQQERLARRLCRERELDLTVVRPANVYGPGSRPWVEMVLPLLARGDVTLLGGGDHDAGLVHVENLADLLVRVAASPRAVGATYNAADGEGVTWKRYFGDLAEAVGAPPPRSIPRAFAAPAGRLFELLWRLRNARHRPPITREAVQLTARGLDLPTDRARADLGWTPRLSYDDAIRELQRSVRAMSSNLRSADPAGTPRRRRG